MLIISYIKVNIIYDKKKIERENFTSFQIPEMFCVSKQFLYFPWMSGEKLRLAGTSSFHPVHVQKGAGCGWLDWKKLHFWDFRVILNAIHHKRLRCCFFFFPPLHHCTSVFLPHFPPLGFRQMFGRSAPKSPNFPRSHAEAARPLFSGRAIPF